MPHIVLLLITLVAVPAAAAKNVVFEVNVIGLGARASGSGCTDSDHEPEPLVVHVDWVGVGPVISEKWRQTSEQGGGCYGVESVNGDSRSATGTIDGVGVTFDDELNTAIFEGHQNVREHLPQGSSGPSEPSEARPVRGGPLLRVGGRGRAHRSLNPPAPISRHTR